MHPGVVAIGSRLRVHALPRPADTEPKGQIAGGAVKAFAVTIARRLTTPALRNLPTLDESGMKGFDVSVWPGLCAPKGTPRAVVDKINATLRTALLDPEFVKREEAPGAVPIADARVGGEEHKGFVAAETAKWGPILEAAGRYAD